MRKFTVHRTFGTWTRGQVATLDPESDGTKALLRDGYITPKAPPRRREDKAT